MTLLSLDNKTGSYFAPITYGLWENGFEVNLLGQDETWSIDRSEFLMCYGPMQGMYSLIDRLSHLRDLPPLIFWQTEQVPKPTTPTVILKVFSHYRYLISRIVDRGDQRSRWHRENKYFQKGGRFRILGELCALPDLKRLAMVGVFSETNASVLKKLDLPVTVTPMGGSVLWGQNSGLTRDIDVVFLGTTRDARRRKIIHRLTQEFNQKSIRFIIRDGSPEHGYIFGDQRTELLNRTKIMLGLMRQPWDDNLIRFILSALNGCMLVSEAIIPTSRGPLVNDENCVLVEIKTIVERVQYYLEHESERERISQQATKLVNTEMSMGNMVNQLLIRSGIL